MEQALKEAQWGANIQTPLPPLPGPVSKAAFTIQQARTHVPAPIVKLFKAQITPLAEQELPDPQDLSAFWGGVERAIQSLDPSFKDFEVLFGEEHIAHLGPYILGARGWA